MVLARSDSGLHRVPVTRTGPSLIRARATKNWLPPSRGQFKGSAFREDILPPQSSPFLSKITKSEMEIEPAFRGCGDLPCCMRIGEVGSDEGMDSKWLRKLGAFLRGPRG